MTWICCMQENIGFNECQWDDMAIWLAKRMDDVDTLYVKINNN